MKIAILGAGSVGCYIGGALLDAGADVILIGRARMQARLAGFGMMLTNYGQSLWVAIAVTLVFAALMGAINGQIVIRTRLPSFIVTLAFLFILRGLTLVGLKWATGGSTQLRGITEAVGENPLRTAFSGVAFEGLFARLASEIGQ